jgi:3-hydroxypropanoate dehydrogenase
MNKPIAKSSIQQLFTEARTHHAWKDKPVSDELLKEIYDLAKWGPTSANASPLRIVFVKSKAAKEKLLSALAGPNVEQVRAAPVTAILAYDQKFFDHLPRLFPAYDMRPMFCRECFVERADGFSEQLFAGRLFHLGRPRAGVGCGTDVGI